MHVKFKFTWEILPRRMGLQGLIIIIRAFRAPKIIWNVLGFMLAIQFIIRFVIVATLSMCWWHVIRRQFSRAWMQIIRIWLLIQTFLTRISIRIYRWLKIFRTRTVNGGENISITIICVTFWWNKVVGPRISDIKLTTTRPNIKIHLRAAKFQIFIFKFSK